AFRDRFKIPISDDEIKDRIPFYRPDEDSPEIRYLKARRKALGGYLPVRRDTAPPLHIPDGIFDKMRAGTDEHEISTTMALVRVLASLLRDPELGPRVVPIVPDESRTFGMEGMFRQLGIYAPFGQLYEPEDAGKLAYYREEKTGQVLEEGINEAGAMSSFVAAGTSYSTHGLQMIPFYIFYSMFGFQRVGDLIWSAGDLQARGFLIGGTAGRTTLPGEGLQHQDGHSHLAAAGVPNCYPYDVAYAYEVAVIVEDGLRRMCEQRENRFYYLTVENENYAHPPMPESAQEGILAGLHQVAEAQDPDAPRVQLLGSGAILCEVLAAAERLRAYGVESDVWSVTSFVLLARDGARVERHNRLHPESPQTPWVEQCLAEHPGPIIAASDYVRMHAEQIRSCLPAGRDYRVLGTDGFGRSDTREKLREFFEVNADHILHVTARALEASGQIDPATTKKIVAECAVDPDRPDPFAS
ncbi:MAG: pyruvate dehydrogenase (acetyl-transferring), homodimeric type, partial [Gammaproteobacteria bacterium]|nr:pyruvate dehydrogenase (acetyl-transferring), homodimeric type [Gammaproteobacteria bacterium]